MRKIISRAAVVLATLLFSAGVITAVAIPAESAVPAAAGTPGALTAIRTGAHPTYDRIVLDFPGGVPEVRDSRFVEELIRDPSGEVESLPGDQFAQVTMFPAATYDLEGNPTYLGPRKFTTPGLNNVTAIAITGDFEGYLTIAMGMREKTWLHVFTLTGPPRVVIDVGR
jgi:hypothetical protein